MLLQKLRKLSSLKLAQTLPYTLLIGGIIGVFSAGILTVEKIELIKNPNTDLGCNLNPIVACGSVITTPQAEAFGFPNPLIGLVGFGILATIGAAMLAGAKFRRWFWLCVQLGVLFGIGFVTWLQFQSIYRIGALCPFCMTVWAVMIPIFWYTTLYNFKQGHIKVKANLQPMINFIQQNHVGFLVVWYLSIIGAILERFWYYWSTLL